VAVVLLNLLPEPEQLGAQFGHKAERWR
jgi:hypothetical protein